jgi:hypothetical protein
MDSLAFPFGCLPFLSDDSFWNQKQNPILSQDVYDHNVVMQTWLSEKENDTLAVIAYTTVRLIECIV